MVEKFFLCGVIKGILYGGKKVLQTIECLCKDSVFTFTKGFMLKFYLEFGEFG